MKKYFENKVLHGTGVVSYERAMLKAKQRTKIGIAVSVVAVLATIPFMIGSDSSAETANTTFQVNVKETLAVTVTPPASWASGDTGNFLSNTVKLSVTTNNASGFLANMYSSSNNSATVKTSLANNVDSTKTIPTLASSVTCSTGCSNFTANYWGYKVTSQIGSTSVSSDPTSGTYLAMATSSSPSILINASSSTGGTTGTSGAASIDFGSRITSATASGTYENTVVINVVTAPSSNTAPSSPAVASDDAIINDAYATYVSGSNRTVYTTTSNNAQTGTTSTTTQVTSGDTTSMYPLGETFRNSTESNVTNVENGTKLATGLAVASAAAAAGGMVFFILAKRREEDEEDEKTLQQ